jgi:hypothetical protein
MPVHDLVIVLNQQVFSNPFGELNLLAILSDYLIPALSGEIPDREIIDISLEELSRLEGHYESVDSNEFIDVLAEEGKLVLNSSDGQQNDFYPLTKNTFEARILDLLNVKIEFETDSGSNSITLISEFGYTSKRFSRQ